MKSLTLVFRGSGNLTREIVIPNAKTYDPTGKETDKDEFFNDDDLKEFEKRIESLSTRITYNGEYIKQIYAIKEKTDTTEVVLISGY